MEGSPDNLLLVEIQWLQQRLHEVETNPINFGKAVFKELRGFEVAPHPVLTSVVNRLFSHQPGRHPPDSSPLDLASDDDDFDDVIDFCLSPFRRFIETEYKANELHFVKLSNKTPGPLPGAGMMRDDVPKMINSFRGIALTPTSLLGFLRDHNNTPVAVLDGLDNSRIFTDHFKFFSEKRTATEIYDFAFDWNEAEGREVTLTMRTKLYWERVDVRSYYVDTNLSRHVTGCILERIWTPRKFKYRDANRTSRWYPARGANTLSGSGNASATANFREEIGAIFGDISSFTANCPSPNIMILIMIMALTFLPSWTDVASTPLVFFVGSEPVTFTILELLRVYWYHSTFPTANVGRTTTIIIGGCLGVSWNMQLTISYFSWFLSNLKRRIFPMKLFGQIGGDDFLLLLVGAINEVHRLSDVVLRLLKDFVGQVKNPRVQIITFRDLAVAMGLFCKKRTALNITRQTGSFTLAVSTLPHLPLELHNLILNRPSEEEVRVRFESLYHGVQVSLSDPTLRNFIPVYLEGFFVIYCPEKDYMEIKGPQEEIPRIHDLPVSPLGHVTQKALDKLANIPEFVDQNQHPLLWNDDIKISYLLKCGRLRFEVVDALTDCGTLKKIKVVTDKWERLDVARRTLIKVEQPIVEGSQMEGALNTFVESYVSLRSVVND